MLGTLQPRSVEILNCVDPLVSSSNYYVSCVFSCPHRTREDIERVAYDYCEGCARQNVAYVEMRGSPFVNDKIAPADFTDGFVTGLERGMKDFNIKARAILCFMRNDPGLL